MVLIPFFLLWFIGKCIRLAIAAAQEEKMRKIREEQERIRAEQAWMREEAKREEARRKALEKEQERQAKEQARLAKEQERMAAKLAKHEEEIAKLKFRMEQDEMNIGYYDERMRNLMAKRDNYMEQQYAYRPNSAEWDKLQSKIITLDNQIHATETKLAKAQFDKDFCVKKISA